MVAGRLKGLEAVAVLLGMAGSMNSSRNVREICSTSPNTGTASASSAPSPRCSNNSVTRKLAERDPHRPDNETISPEDAREGAERLAAALTFGKSFTLRAPGHDPDPSLAAGALDPADILTNWTDAWRNALLRRGIFAPATYGRIRFHHRSTQEYLAASWLDRLLRNNCPRTEIFQLLFAERYGVETVVPFCRPRPLGHRSGTRISGTKLFAANLKPSRLRRSGLPFHPRAGTAPLAVRL